MRPRVLAGLACLVWVTASGAQEKPVPRVVVADFVVTGLTAPRYWLGPVYSAVLARRLRPCLEMLVTEPLALRQAAQGSAPREIEGVVEALLQAAQSCRAAYAIGGLIEDLGAKLRITPVIVPSGPGKPYHPLRPEVTLDKLFQPQIDVVLAVFLRAMGIRVSAESYQAMVEYEPPFTPDTMELLGKGWRLYSPETPEDSFRLWRQALALDRKCALAEEALAETGRLYRQRLAEQAVAFYEREIANAPKDAAPHYHLAELYAEQGRWSPAAVEYERAVTLRMNFVDAYVGWGVAWLEMGQLEQAIAKFNGALVLEPTNRKALYNKGVALYRRGYNKEAIKQWEEVVRLYPDDKAARAALQSYGGAPTPGGPPAGGG
jgi:tetratricopeptide (TPR) repeat protein